MGAQKTSTLRSVASTETIPITRHYLLRGASAEDKSASPPTPLAKESSIKLSPCDSLWTAYAVAAEQQRYSTARNSANSADPADAYTGHTHTTESYAANICTASDTPAVNHRYGSCHGEKSPARPVVCCSMVCLAVQLRGHLQHPHARPECKSPIHD
jgi:hypothetical protein